MGLFVHTQNHRILRRIQIQSHDIRGLSRKLRIGTDIPTPAPLQVNSLSPQGSPDLMGTHIAETSCQEGSGLAGESLGRRFIQSLQNPAFCILVISTRRPLARGVLQSLDSLFAKSGPPLAHPGRSGLHRPGIPWVVPPLAATRMILALSTKRDSVFPERIPEDKTFLSSQVSVIIWALAIFPLQTLGWKLRGQHIN